jgi:hypothetical protein
METKKNEKKYFSVHIEKEKERTRWNHVNV